MSLPLAPVHCPSKVGRAFLSILALELVTTQPLSSWGLWPWWCWWCWCPGARGKLLQATGAVDGCRPPRLCGLGDDDVPGPQPGGPSPVICGPGELLSCRLCGEGSPPWLCGPGVLAFWLCGPVLLQSFSSRDVLVLIMCHVALASSCLPGVLWALPENPWPYPSCQGPMVLSPTFLHLPTTSQDLWPWYCADVHMAKWPGHPPPGLCSPVAIILTLGVWPWCPSPAPGPCRVLLGREDILK